MEEPCAVSGALSSISFSIVLVNASVFRNSVWSIVLRLAELFGLMRRSFPVRFGSVPCIVPAISLSPLIRPSCDGLPSD